MIETTFVMIKPDGVQRRLIGEVVSRLERRGLSVVGMKLMRVPRELAEEHYRDHVGKHFYEPLLEFITSGPVVAMAIRGVEAIERVRDLMGATKPEEASVGTIRGDFVVSNRMNIVHGADGTENAQRELSLFFAAAEILDYESCDRVWLAAESEMTE